MELLQVLHSARTTLVSLIRNLLILISNNVPRKVCVSE